MIYFPNDALFWGCPRSLMFDQQFKIGARASQVELLPPLWISYACGTAFLGLPDWFDKEVLILQNRELVLRHTNLDAQYSKATSIAHAITIK